jgi:integrase
MNEQPSRILIGDRVSICARGKRGNFTAEFWWEGQHRRVALKTRNLKVAKQRAVRLASELASGSYVTAPVAKPTLSRAVDDYLDYLKTENRRRKTLIKYGGVLQSFVHFATTHRVKFLAQLSATLFDQFRAARRDSLSAKSIYNESVIIKQLLKWCKSRRLIAENPLTDIKLCKPPVQPAERPSIEQVNSILAACREPLRSILSVLAFSGMRVGQLQRLRPEDVDMLGNWIYIQPVEGAKTAHLVKVPIHPRLRPLLKRLPKRERPWFFTAASSRRYPDGDHWLNPKHLNEAFERIARKQGMSVGRKIKGFTLHSLRGFFETFCVNNRIPQRVIDTWLGHRSDRSMASVYYKLSDHESQQFMGEVPFGDGLPMTTQKESGEVV